MTTIDGDLLAIKDGFILHQVNCFGITGGLAGALRRAHPEAFDGYRNACMVRSGCSIPLGEMIVGDAAGGRLSIVHIFGQAGFGFGRQTDYEAVGNALERFRQYRAGLSTGSERASWPVYAPYMMGCGLGGGCWDIYRELLTRNVPDIIIVVKSSQVPNHKRMTHDK